MWYVYVLLCEDSSLYTGISNQVEKRFIAHSAGRGAKYTKSHKPIKIIFQESWYTKSEALKREMEIKGWSREEKIRNLELKIR